MKVFIIIFGLAALAFAQEEDPLKYFPYKTGDMWEYYLYDLQYPDTSQTFNIMDSTDTQGNIYVKQISRRINPIQPPFLFPDTAIYKIDISFNVFAPPNAYGPPFTEYFLAYKLNAQQGEQWVIYDYSQIGGNGFEVVRLREVWEGDLFGNITTFKSFIYFYSADSSDTLGMVRYGDVLAEGFGLWSRGGGETFGNWYLKGCVINDTLYGDTTNIITSVKDLSENLPSDFELFPNYPNPFNSTTTISFRNIKAQNISLIVYDMMGREVRKLIDNEFYYPGIYKKNWDSKNNFDQLVSSGVYYYRLITNGIDITRPMILMK